MSPFRARVRRSSVVIATTVLFIIGITANGARMLRRGAPGLTLARTSHAAAPLRGGELLIVGGFDGKAPLAESEIFNLADGSVHAGPHPIYARAEHTATSLKDGNVLVTGGRDGAMALDTAEMYDARTQSFALTGRMTTARVGHTATMLADGRVLVAGNGTAEIFDATTRDFTALDARMNVERSAHSAALLADGRVLFAGGRDAKGNAIDSAEVFDGESFVAIRAMNAARVHPTLRTLPDGKVQIIGGDKDGTMEIFDGVKFTAKAVINRDSSIEREAPQSRLALNDRVDASVTRIEGATVIAGGATRDRMTSDVTVVPDRAWVTTKESEV